MRSTKLQIMVRLEITIENQSLLMGLFSNLLWISKIRNPNKTAPIMSALFNIPSVENEIFIRMVDITNPEFLIIL